MGCSEIFRHSGKKRTVIPKNLIELPFEPARPISEVPGRTGFLFYNLIHSTVVFFPRVLLIWASGSSISISFSSVMSLLAFWVSGKSYAPLKVALLSLCKMHAIFRHNRFPVEMEGSQLQIAHRGSERFNPVFSPKQSVEFQATWRTSNKDTAPVY